MLYARTDVAQVLQRVEREVDLELQLSARGQVVDRDAGDLGEVLLGDLVLQEELADLVDDFELLELVEVLEVLGLFLRRRLGARAGRRFASYKAYLKRLVLWVSESAFETGRILI